MNKRAENKINFFKDNFTLGQYAAFALSFNQAGRQLEKLSTTYHFQRIYGRRRDKVPSFKESLKNLRNYFSHCASQWPDEERFKKSVLRNELDFLVLEAIAILEQRNTKLHDNDETAKDIKKELDKIRSSPSDFFPLDNSGKNIQPTLALVLSLFLTKNQMAFLLGKIFRGNGVTRESPQYLAQAKILETLSQNDRTLVDTDSQSERFTSHDKEFGLAIAGRLEAVGLYEEQQKIEDFPEDVWFIKQLVLYLEYMNVLPSVQFCRMTTIEKDDQLLQEKDFDIAHREKPLRIRCNTVEAQVKLSNGAPYTTNFGVQSLKYLVLAHLKKTFEDKEIDQLVVRQIESNPSRKCRKAKESGVTGDRLTKRIEYLIGKHTPSGENPVRLYEQIRFICRFVNEAWFKRYNRHMNSEEFKDIQERVRHYRRDDFQKLLKESDLLDIAGLNLGAGNDKKLGSCFRHERIQNIFCEMESGYLEWLENRKQQIDKLSQEEREALAARINLRHREGRSSQEAFRPVSISADVLRREIESRDKAKNKRRFFDHIRDFGGSARFFARFDLDDRGWGSARDRERWARTGLLSQIVLKSLSGANIKNMLDQKPSQWECEERVDGTKITFKLTQGWRYYAATTKTQLRKLIGAYRPDLSVLPLLDDGGIEGGSVQSLKRTLERERYRLMQAILVWEREIIEKHDMKPDGGYIKFESILEKGATAEQAPDLKDIRNHCMHGDIWKAPFSQAPEPLRRVYSGLEEKSREKRRSQKKSGIKRSQKNQK